MAGEAWLTGSADAHNAGQGAGRGPPRAPRSLTPELTHRVWHPQLTAECGRGGRSRCRPPWWQSQQEDPQGRGGEAKHPFSQQGVHRPHPRQGSVRGSRINDTEVKGATQMRGGTGEGVPVQVEGREVGREGLPGQDHPSQVVSAKQKHAGRFAWPAFLKSPRSPTPWARPQLCPHPMSIHPTLQVNQPKLGSGHHSGCTMGPRLCPCGDLSMMCTTCCSPPHTHNT